MVMTTSTFDGLLNAYVHMLYLNMPLLGAQRWRGAAPDPGRQRGAHERNHERQQPLVKVARRLPNHSEEKVRAHLLTLIVNDLSI